MGIYLPKVDMPQNGETITIQICPDGSIWQARRGTIPGAKAVPVPEHGRLIDADAIKRELGVSDRDIYVQDCLDEAPTIIPAIEEVQP